MSKTILAGPVTGKIDKLVAFGANYDAEHDVLHQRGEVTISIAGTWYRTRQDIPKAGPSMVTLASAAYVSNAKISLMIHSGKIDPPDPDHPHCSYSGSIVHMSIGTLADQENPPTIDGAKIAMEAIRFEGVRVVGLHLTGDTTTSDFSATRGTVIAELDNGARLVVLPDPRDPPDPCDPDPAKRILPDDLLRQDELARHTLLGVLAMALAARKPINAELYRWDAGKKLGRISKLTWPHPS